MDSSTPFFRYASHQLVPVTISPFAASRASGFKLFVTDPGSTEFSLRGLSQDVHHAPFSVGPNIDLSLPRVAAAAPSVFETN